jgi:molybdopterin/thiamine biosynthesis adenylyltransferase
MSLSAEERDRYRRQLGLAQWDQERLKSSAVLVAGVGGLGGVSSLYLALAGVGRIRLADPDRVETSNLNRQILFDRKSLGRLKVEEAGRRLREANPHVEVELSPEAVTRESLPRQAAGVSLLVDGLDSVGDRFLVNEYSVRTAVPYLYGAVRGWEGMVGLFHPPRTGCLACLFSSPVEPPGEAPVFGGVAGFVGVIQAVEALKFLMGVPRTLEGRLLIYDSRDLSFDLVEVQKNPLCPVCSGR